MRALLRFTVATFSDLPPATSVTATTTTIPAEPMDDYNLSLTITLCVLVGVATFMSVFTAITIYKHRRQNFSRTGSSSPAPPRYLFVVELQPVSPKRGLKKSALRALPKRRYEKVPDVEKQAECCVICLTEFEEGDEIRKLPECSHKFHVGCVDRWLQAQPSCPCCRRKVGVIRRSDP